MYWKLDNLIMIQKPFLFVFFITLLSGADGAKLVTRLPGFSGELPFKLETGYVGIGKYERVQLYYYFVESQRDPVHDPLILWLTGGPGCSALSGMLYEIGPFQFDYKAFNGSLPSLILKPYSFTKVANVIFLDAPVGTGFSYSESYEDYVKDDIASSNANHQFLQKWLRDHPKFLNNSLYIGGDSYSGKIVPILVHEIYTGQKMGQFPKMNLQGYVLGNPVTDHAYDESTRFQFAHRLGLISDELYESTKVHCGDEYPDITNVLCLDDIEAVEKCTKAIFLFHVLEPNCDFSPELEYFENNQNLADSNISLDDIVAGFHGRGPWCRVTNFVLSFIWANDPTVQEALHVRKDTKDMWRRCSRTVIDEYQTDAVPSVINYHRSLIDSGYRALIYSGDHDMCIPYLGTMKWITTLNLTVSDPWRPWMVNYQVAGFTKTFTHGDTYELTFATIKGSGHTAPEYKPEPCLEMFDRWLAHARL